MGSPKPAAGYGSTSSSSAVIRTFYSTRDGCALAWEGLHVWRDWQNFLKPASIDPLANFVECPALVLQNGEPDGLDAACRHLRDLGVPWEQWSADKLAAEFPSLDRRCYAPPRQADDPLFGDPNGGYVTDPQLAARNLQQAAEANGASFRFNARITEIRTGDHRVTGITLDDGKQLDAPVVVNAAGPYSSELNRMAGVDGGMSIHTRALRQEVCHLPRPENFLPAGALSEQRLSEHPLSAHKGLIVIDADVGTYFRTEQHDALFVGGMEPECDPLVWVDDPDTLDRNPSPVWQSQALRQALRLPAMGIPGQARGVVDIYDVSDDWAPIYDKSDLDGFYMAVGTSGNQFKNGPIAGQLMADLIDACEQGHDHDQTPYQFPLPYTGLVLDTGAFSRRRVANAESTMGVLG